jgi:hypothetical protein
MTHWGLSRQKHTNKTYQFPASITVKPLEILITMSNCVMSIGILNQK